MLAKLRMRIGNKLRTLLSRLTKLDRSSCMRRLLRSVVHRFPGLGLRLRRLYLSIRSGENTVAGASYSLPQPSISRAGRRDGRLASQRSPLERHFRDYVDEGSA